MAGIEITAWRGTIHTAVDNGDCDDYFLRQETGLPYGLDGRNRSVNGQIADLRDTDIPVFITGTLYAQVADMRGFCIVVREIRRVDATPVPLAPTDTPVPPTPTSTPTAAPTDTPRPLPTATNTPLPLPEPSATPTDTPLAPTATPSATPTPWPTPTNTPALPLDYSWWAEYYPNTSLAGPPTLVRTEYSRELNWSWGTGAPSGEVPSDNFTARWRGVFFFLPVRYRFMAAADDGVRVYLDGRLIIDEWHQWQNRTYAIEVPMRLGGRHEVVVEYLELGGTAQVWAGWEQLDDFANWRGDYFAGRTPGQGWVMSRNDAAIDFDWGRGSPHPSLGSDDFSVRWTKGTELQPGSYRFWVRANDGVRLHLDGNLVFNSWTEGMRQFSTLVEGISRDYHTFELEYYEATDLAFVQFWWEYLGTQPGEPLP